jgi:hypothetical protein
MEEQDALPSMKRCPMCAEEVLAAAVKCKHCGSIIETAKPSDSLPSRPARSSTAKVGLIFFGLLGGAVVLLGVLGLVSDGVGTFTALWNIAVGAGLLWILLQLRRGRDWAHDWAVGSSGINAIGYLIAAAKAPVLLALVVISIVAAVCLSRSKAELISDEAPLRRKLRPLESAAVVLLLLGSLAANQDAKKSQVLPPPQEQPAPAWIKQGKDRSIATENAKLLVKKNLNAPDSVKFQATKILAEAGDFFMVQVLFDAQNGFGAMIRANHCVTLSHSS